MRRHFCLHDPRLRSQAGRTLVSSHLSGSLLLALVIAFCCCRCSPLLSLPAFALLDTWFNHRPTRAVDSRIALIGIDAEVIQAFQKAKLKAREGDPCNCNLIRRDLLARLITNVKQAHPKVVGLDLYFESPCPVHDKPLLKALDEPPDTVMCSGMSPTPGGYNFLNMPAFVHLKRPPIIASPVLYNPTGRIRGVPMVQEDQPLSSNDKPGGHTVIMTVRPPLAAAV